MITFPDRLFISRVFVLKFKTPAPVFVKPCVPINSAKIASLDELFPVTLKIGELSACKVSAPPRAEFVLLPNLTAAPNALLAVKELIVGLAPKRTMSQLDEVVLSKKTAVPFPLGPPTGADGLQLLSVQFPPSDPFQVKFDWAADGCVITINAQKKIVLHKTDFKILNRQGTSLPYVEQIKTATILFFLVSFSGSPEV
jgi:hypothetical protein